MNNEHALLVLVLLDSCEKTTVDDDADPSLWEEIDYTEEIDGVLSCAKRIPCFAHLCQHSGMIFRRL